MATFQLQRSSFVSPKKKDAKSADVLPKIRLHLSCSFVSDALFPTRWVARCRLIRLFIRSFVICFKMVSGFVCVSLAMSQSLALSVSYFVSGYHSLSLALALALTERERDKDRKTQRQR
eukprot:m.88950 g.88950  ORF g.88950 m.88950 type:complete len:119 (+) comp26247_c1_seq1:150-506(+)